MRTHQTSEYEFAESIASSDLSPISALHAGVVADVQCQERWLPESMSARAPFERDCTRQRAIRTLPGSPCNPTRSLHNCQLSYSVANNEERTALILLWVDHPCAHPNQGCDCKAYQPVSLQPNYLRVSYG